MNGDTILNNIPNEVLWASGIIFINHGIGIDTYEKIEEIIAKYPEYFPWETKYNSIPKEVHESYIKEKYPDRDKPIVCTNNGEGLYSKIKNESFIYREYTPEEVGEWFRQLEATIVKERNEVVLQRKKDKKLWDKHYKKYNLEYRE